MPQTIDAVFFDRDGTLIVNRPYLGRPEGVELLQGTREALRIVRDSGGKLFLFTNQSGVGRGYFTMADVERVHRRMLELLDLGDDLFSAVCIAPERPDEPSRYRNPSPRLIVEQLAAPGIAPERAWMIGDAPSDWEAGRRADGRACARRRSWPRPRWLARASSRRRRPTAWQAIRRSWIGSRRSLDIPCYEGFRIDRRYGRA